jgi:cytochrome b subunit of formate dehydrogenase
MSPALARPLLHMVHLLTFAALLATGLLLFVPALRALVTGGYSLLIREVHCWGGIAFAGLPVFVLIRFGPRAVLFPSAPKSGRALWQATHVAITVFMGLVFTVSGFAIWAKRSVPENFVEVSRSLHEWFTYAAVILVILHLGEIGFAAVVNRIKSAAVAPQPEA